MSVLYLFTKHGETGHIKCLFLYFVTLHGNYTFKKTSVGRSDDSFNLQLIRDQEPITGLATLFKSANSNVK